MAPDNNRTIRPHLHPRWSVARAHSGPRIAQRISRAQRATQSAAGKCAPNSTHTSGLCWPPARPRSARANPNNAQTRLLQVATRRWTVCSCRFTLPPDRWAGRLISIADYLDLPEWPLGGAMGRLETDEANSSSVSFFSAESPHSRRPVSQSEPEASQSQAGGKRATVITSGPCSPVVRRRVAATTFGPPISVATRRRFARPLVTSGSTGLLTEGRRWRSCVARRIGQLNFLPRGEVAREPESWPAAARDHLLPLLSRRGPQASARKAIHLASCGGTGLSADTPAEGGARVQPCECATERKCANAPVCR